MTPRTSELPHRGLTRIHVRAAAELQRNLLDVRHSHKPIILEGQSGTGKTSCVRHILGELDLARKPEYLSARDPFHVRTIARVVTDHWWSGSYVIDDFHRLTIDLQEQMADLQLSADLQRSDLPKLIIIGINQVGTQLIQLVPDIAKRTGIHRISPGRREDIDKLIQRVRTTEHRDKERGRYL